MRSNTKPITHALFGILLFTTGLTCSSSEKAGSSSTSGDPPNPPPPLPTSLAATITKTRFLTADHMLASIEMQLSGEPFAELLGRDLGGYDRFSATTDNYVDPETGKATVDGLGFALAVESYEYSKQSMNNLSFESGAGLSLQFGPRQNPMGQEGDAAYALLRDRIQYLGKASRASGAKFGKDFVLSPPPANDPKNPYGWPGLYPVFAEFRSFDPAIKAAAGASAQCSLAGATDEPLPPGTTPTFVGDYECDSTSLNLPDRDTQVDKVLEPDALGYAAWKQMLWVINYWATMHDVGQNPITVVSGAQLKSVGEPDNKVIGQFPSPLDPTGKELVFGKDGTFLGGVSLEGFQGLVMLDEIDNKSSLLLQSLLTSDGKTLSGLPSVKAGLDYDYTSKLTWWPASVAVTEAKTAPDASQALRLFPKPTALAIAAGESRIQDLSGLLGGFATLYAFTDIHNAELGGGLPARATFDGAPFAADNQLPDGEDSPHDRALAILKVALVDLDRLHFDDAHAVLVDVATPSASGVTRGASVSTLRAAYAIVALRTTLRGLSASLSLYSNDTPDTLGAPTPLDQTKLSGAPFTGALGGRVLALIRAEADFLADKLVTDTGLAANGYDLASGARDAAPTTLEAQAAAIRGLLEAYLATSNERYRVRAADAYASLEKTFWMDDIRAFRGAAGESSRLVYTPRAYGALQGALRQYWKLVASRPGQEAAAAMVLARVLRTMKLVANGWNDANEDGLVQPDECLGGRLQMAERALTGEDAVPADKGDRDHDCVPDIATAGLPAALAGELVIERK
jgi:hypothetical protein